MTEAEARNSLQAIQEALGGILESGSRDVVDAAILEAKLTRKKYDASIGQTHSTQKAKEWGYEITPLTPLQFKTSLCGGHLLRVDISCDLRWSNEKMLKQDVAMRVWATEEKLVFREKWDSHQVLDYLTASSSSDLKRVMFRCHFDLAASNQPGPENHLQVGGNGVIEEQCWFPDSVKIPRFAYPPMDLLLVCQMVAANFFPDEYNNIRKQPAWRRRVINSERLLWKPYYDRCQEYFNGHENASTTWLEEFWNTQKP